MTRRLVIAALVVVVAALTGCTASAPPPVAATTPAAVELLPAERNPAAAPLRLAEDLIPPTNRWFSSLVFSEVPLPVFPFPLAFAPTPTGFSLDLPTVAVTADSIATPFSGGLAVDLGAASFTVTAYDEVAVTLTYADADGAAIADVTIAEGWPAVGVTARRALPIAFGGSLASAGDGAWTMKADGTAFAVVAANAEARGDALEIPAGESAQVSALPVDAEPATWIAAFGDPVAGVVTSFEASATRGGEAASTRLEYTGTAGTVLVPFPGMDAAAGACDLGSYDTAYGQVDACRGTTLERRVARISPRASFDLTGLDGEAHEELVDHLSADIAGTGDAPEDTYFGGKALARLATLLALARSLGEDDLAARAADLLEAGLGPWAQVDGCVARDERCFAYDARLHTVVGREPSFGSEEGNDHHFHYGHFLFAAGVLAEERPEAVEMLRPVMDLLAADIAAGGDPLPGLRVFDPYRGHSWASGLSPFADGNNQESSSEAVAAWNGLALWAAASGDADLRERAEWLLSGEADSARRLWLEPTGLPEGYAHTVVSLTWGAKRDHATWFSDEPSAILGIQLLPVSPIGLQYLAGDPRRVALNVAGAGGESAFGGPLGDYVLLYSALAGPAALDRAEELARERASWDDGLSRSAALAWLAAVRLRSG
ncbi:MULTISPECIES: glycosyl hydrolase [Microbacterium]|uniref:glucan endo-1,3-beta-D-glucosidase n=1 Tax=Microbacterium saccharophilum TaxID=1213358 RepID=A0A7Z7CXL3_9MICO|nr:MULTISPECIES: glycosyl hydrolase [Microbacterium]SFI23327.1 Endoglucanase Acf2 [Microbacterium saccharophilum]